MLTVTVNSDNTSALSVIEIPSERCFERRALTAVFGMNEHRASFNCSDLIKIFIIILSAAVINNDNIVQACILKSHNCGKELFIRLVRRKYDRNGRTVHTHF
jgi:hypothetical protein